MSEKFDNILNECFFVLWSVENKKFEIGQKTLQTDTQIVVISFFRFKGIYQKFWAFGQMGFARKKLKKYKRNIFKTYR